MTDGFAQKYGIVHIASLDTFAEELFDIIGDVVVRPSEYRTCLVGRRWEGGAKHVGEIADRIVSRQ